jgi:hypothetical protein
MCIRVYPSNLLGDRGDFMGQLNIKITSRDSGLLQVGARLGPAGLLLDEPTASIV